MENHYRIAFTATFPESYNEREAQRRIERALNDAMIRVGPVGIATSRETLRARRLAARIERAAKEA